MAVYATIQEQIDETQDLEVSFKNLHTTAVLKYSDSTIRIPYQSIFRAYMPFFRDILVQAEFTPEEIVKYRKAPKVLSYDLYDTVEVWSALLEVNNCFSIVDFDFDSEHQPYMFDPTSFKSLVNEILILEGVLE